MIFLMIIVKAMQRMWTNKMVVLKVLGIIGIVIYIGLLVFIGIVITVVGSDDRD